MTADSDPLYDRAGWWDPACREFRSLRATSEFRLRLLRDWLPGAWSERLVVDLGCGGGLLGIPLAESGARVLGVDLAREALLDASRRNQRRFAAIAADLTEAPVAANCADLVMLADVLEHVPDPGAAIATAANLLRPGGHVFVHTIHRTIRSRLLAITLAEGLGFVPRGTHEWRMFVTPDELDRMCDDAGLRRVYRTGEAPRIWRTLRTGAIALRESASLAVSYAALYRRAP